VPHGQALQVFYGSIPLIIVFIGVYFRESLVLRSILDRLSGIENRLTNIEKTVASIDRRVVMLETRAGVIYHE
jgi:hypothetical protein